MRAAAGTKSGPPSRVTRSTKAMIACLEGPSFHEARVASARGATLAATVEVSGARAGAAVPPQAVASSRARASGARPALQKRDILLPHQRPLRVMREIGVLRLLDRHPDEVDLATCERGRLGVGTADGVSAVVADAEPVSGQRKLACLSLQRPLGDDL